jgi:hypothetical protein
MVGMLATVLTLSAGGTPGGGQIREHRRRVEQAEYEVQLRNLQDKSAVSAPPPDPSMTPTIEAFEAAAERRKDRLKTRFERQRSRLDEMETEIEDEIQRLESEENEIESMRRSLQDQLGTRLDAINAARQDRLDRLERQTSGALDTETVRLINSAYDDTIDELNAKMGRVDAAVDATLTGHERTQGELGRLLERVSELLDGIDQREQAALSRFDDAVARERRRLQDRRMGGAGSGVASSGGSSGPSDGGWGAGSGSGSRGGGRGGAGGERTRSTGGSGAETGRSRERRDEERETRREPSEAERETMEPEDEEAAEQAGQTGTARSGHGLESGPTTSEEAFGDLGEELGMEEATEPEGTVEERTRESVRRAEKAGWVDEEGQPVLDEEGRPVGPGAAAQEHYRAGAVREELGVSGRGEGAQESAHIVPQAFIRQIPGYSTGLAKTVLLPKGVHDSLDSTWKEWAKSRRRAGETTTTIGEGYRVLLKAIDSARELSADRQSALQQILTQEMFSEQGLDQSREIALPYPNLSPGGGRSVANAENFEAVQRELIGEPADEVPESTLERLGYYRKPSTTPTQIVRKRADDAKYVKLTVDEETGHIAFSSD